MGTSLYAITNAQLTGTENKRHWDGLLEQLRALNLPIFKHYDVEKNGYVDAPDEWEYWVEEAGEFPFQVYYSIPTTISPIFLTNIGIISMIYRYEALYRFYADLWTESVRLNIYRLVQLMGGTEVIYLADNRCHKLSEYFETMALENISYEKIKALMIRELGPPITDYSDLDYSSLDYRNITEFFLDDFSDLR